MCIVRIDVHSVKQMFVHKIVVALVVRLVEPFIFIQIDCLHLAEIHIAFVVPVNQLIICTDRRGACCKA